MMNVAELEGSFFMPDQNIQLFNGDCLSVLPSIADNSIDLVVTSPPYDELRTYSGTLEWNFEVFQAVAQQLTRVLKDGGVIVWIVGDATVKGSETGTSFKQALYFKELGLRLFDTMIYQKTGVTSPSKARYYQAFEYMFVFSKGKNKTFNPILDRKNKWRERWGKTRRIKQADGTFSQERDDRLAPEYGMRFNVWQINQAHNYSTKDKFAAQHPAIFPEQLANDHILSWSNAGDVVLDPFMGSNTTGKMAMLNRRGFIGIEKVPAYFDIAVKRLSTQPALE